MTTRHSEEWFGDWRDHWWNHDFVALLAARFDLGAVRSALDVGSGQGHWGRVLMPHLHEDAVMVGVEREPDWVAAATARAAGHGLAERLRYVHGVAEALPLPDDSFDLVTCQTLLMHLPDPARGLAEMVRVTRPGGLVLCVEPNNLANSVARLGMSLTPEEAIALFELELRAERGKAALGEGDNSFGEALPGHMHAAGLADIQVYTTDKAMPLLPPYDSEEARALVLEWRKIVDCSLWLADEAGSRRYWLAGGGDGAAWPERWALLMRTQRAVVEGLDAGTATPAGGTLGYIVGGRKTAG